MACDLLDLRCIFVNELVGSVALSILLMIIFYFLIASKLRFGFDLTIMLAVPALLLFGIGIGAVSPIMAFLTIIIGFMGAWIFNQIIGNR